LLDDIDVDFEKASSIAVCRMVEVIGIRWECATCTGSRHPNPNHNAATVPVVTKQRISISLFERSAINDVKPTALTGDSFYLHCFVKSASIRNHHPDADSPLWKRTR
jgi:hypothetical protein